MNAYEILIWIVMIYIADLAAAQTRDWWMNRKKPRIQTCDKCDEPIKVYRTKDKLYWLCTTCRKAYYETQRREKRRIEQEQKSATETPE